MKRRNLKIRNDVEVIKISKNDLPPAHASSEDVKLLTNILNPKFFIPVIGEYRHQYAMKGLAKQLGFDDKNVIVMDNGQVLDIKDGEIISTTGGVEYGEIFVDGILDGDVSNVVLRDRELLSEDGVLLIIANIDARNRKILSEPEVVSRGFVYMKDNDELIKEVQALFVKVSNQVFLGKYIDWRVYKEQVKDEISRLLFRLTKRRPIIIPVLVDTQLK